MSYVKQRYWPVTAHNLLPIAADDCCPNSLPLSTAVPSEGFQVQSHLASHGWGYMGKCVLGCRLIKHSF